MQPCNNAYEDFLVSCGYFIRVNAVLLPTSTYTWVIQDKFGNEYSGSVTTDADGLFDIPTGDLPEGILNPFAGNFTLRIQDTECQWLPLRMMGVYDGINFYVKGGDRAKNELGCDVDCVATGTPSNSAVYNFLIDDADNSQRTINWTFSQRQLYGNSPTVQVYKQNADDEFKFDLVNVAIGYNQNETILESLDINFGGIGYFMVIVRG